MAKAKFHQLSEAYTGNHFYSFLVLNDPKKREKYDKFGIR